jgi:hypothetical protein
LIQEEVYERYFCRVDRQKFRDVLSIREEKEWVFELKTIWPIGMIVTDDQILMYSEILKFLCPIRRVIYKLGELRKGLVADESPTVARLLSLLILFFSSYFSFVQADVIEVRFEEMRTVVDGNDIQLICDSHDKFIRTVLAESLIKIDSASVVFKGILELGEKFERVCRSAELRGTWTEPEFAAALVGFDQAIHNDMRIFVTELQNLQSRSIFKSVDRLLLRLDFNKFFLNR